MTISVDNDFVSKENSLARKPIPKVLIKDYYFLRGYDDGSFVSTGPVVQAVASSDNLSGHTILTALNISTNVTVDHLKLFLSNQSSTQPKVTVQICSTSSYIGTLPSTFNPVTGWEGFILPFSGYSNMWQKAYFPTALTLSPTSSRVYWIKSFIADGGHTVYWRGLQNADDKIYVQASGASTWDSKTNAAFLAKVITKDNLVSGTITSISSKNIFASTMSVAADAYIGKLLIINGIGASGNADNLNAAFVVTDNSVSGFTVDTAPGDIDVVVGDSFYLESYENYRNMTEAVSYSVNYDQNRTVNNATIKFFNNDSRFEPDNIFFETVNNNNDVICQLGFSGTSFVNQFRGKIFKKDVSQKTLTIDCQDVLGELQRFPVNIVSASGIAKEKVIQRIAQAKNLTYIYDKTNSTITDAGSDYCMENRSGLNICSKIRESVNYKMFGDVYGRIVFRSRLTDTIAAGYELTEKIHILRDGVSYNSSNIETNNIIGATNDDISGLNTSAERFIASANGSTESSSFTISFPANQVYSNIRWVDSVNDRSVVITERAFTRNSGISTLGSGSLTFNIDQISSSMNYTINIYGNRIIPPNFYVERADGASINELNLNTTKTLISNVFFLSSSEAENTLDSFIKQRGRAYPRPEINCRGPFELELDDQIRLSASNYPNKKIFQLEAYQKNIFHNQAFVTHRLRDTGQYIDVV